MFWLQAQPVSGGFFARVQEFVPWVPPAITVMFGIVAILFLAGMIWVTIKMKMAAALADKERMEKEALAAEDAVLVAAREAEASGEPAAPHPEATPEPSPEPPSVAPPPPPAAEPPAAAPSPKESALPKAPLFDEENREEEVISGAELAAQIAGELGDEKFVFATKETREPNGVFLEDHTKDDSASQVHPLPEEEGEELPPEEEMFVKPTPAQEESKAKEYEELSFSQIDLEEADFKAEEKGGAPSPRADAIAPGPIPRPTPPIPPPGLPPGEISLEEVEVVELEEEEPEEKAAPPEEEPKVSFFKRLRQGLARTRETLIGKIDGLLKKGRQIDEDLLDELEELLVTADMGIHTAHNLLNKVKEQVNRQQLKDAEALRRYLKQRVFWILRNSEIPLKLTEAKPYVIMVVGVNGVGKTTTIAKVAHQFIQGGKKVVIAAADTFRAAAIEQLEIWAARAGAELVKQQSGADPSAVAFDALQAAKSRNADILIVDTAGRLHTKVNLMEELKKIKRIVSRELPGAPHELLLVLDATTGQNAITQAKMFHETLQVTGLALTKLDGTAKGGVIVGICEELALPIRFIGIGEKMDDLRPFIAEDFVEALF